MDFFWSWFVDLGFEIEAMITTLLIYAFVGFLRLILWPLPTITECPSWCSYVTGAFGYLVPFTSLPFFGTVISIALLSLSIMAGYQVVVWTNWLYNKIRGSG